MSFSGSGFCGNCEHYRIGDQGQPGQVRGPSGSITPSDVEPL